MNIESWEILQFFDEPIELPDMSYGLWAFKMEVEQIKIEFHLNLVAKTAEFSINTEIEVKQFIKVGDIEKIESSFDEFSLIKNSERIIRMKKEKPFLCCIEI